ncbi:MAG: NAD-dependent epimerase/dehydratase family protein, partial [Myxococcota bacterium]
MMRLLILGGTRFVGRHMASLALERGYDLTLFNRGQSHPDLFPQATHLRGDREGDLDALADGRWDVVIDTCGYLPRVVRKSAERLRGAVEHVVFISTISVYASSAEPRDESSPLCTLDDPQTEAITGDTYGGLKVLCEEVCQEVFAGRALIIRPGLIVGPHDPTDRLTYWPHRLQQGGSILVPPLATPTQWIDARDLAAWTLDCCEARQTGVYNATGPANPWTLDTFFTACQRAVGEPELSLHPASEAWLLEHEVGAFVELPLWIPKASWGMLQVDISRALAAGLQLRPPQTTLQDTLAWSNTRPEHTWKAGLSREREAELLALLTQPAN